MTFTGFQLDRLTLTGRGVPSAEVRFRAGLNVVSGPSDTGKTFIIQCIDFMFGASKTPKSIPEAERYDTVRLGIKVNGDARAIDLERSLRGGEVKLRIEGQADRVLGAKHTAGDKDSLSHYLLSLAGLSSKKVRTNAQGKTRDLSFRDVARLILVDEEDVIAEKSPIHTGQFTSATVESAVFRLLLTGVDDGSVVAGDDPKVARGRQAGKAEMLQLLLTSTQGRLATQAAGLSARVLDDRVETAVGVASICTMHLAKGLEFRSVAVMACDDEVIPLQARIEGVADKADLEEVYSTERHLLYVACTRAREHLLLTSIEPSSEFLDDLLIQ